MATARTPDNRPLQFTPRRRFNIMLREQVRARSIHQEQQIDAIRALLPPWARRVLHRKILILGHSPQRLLGDFIATKMLSPVLPKRKVTTFETKGPR